MRNLIFSFYFLFIAANCFGQQINFFDNLSGSVGGQVLLGSCTDDDLNLYVTGQVAGTTLHLFNYTYGTPFSGSYTFLVKFNSSHQLVWVRYFQCYSGATKMHGLVADDNDNVYFSVEHGNTNAPIDAYTSDGTFIIKLDQYGVVQWFKPYYADNLRLISNNRIQLIGASNDNNLVEGTFPITNPSGTVITLDTAGTYQSHFFVDLPAYQSERILGVNNQNQFYGYRAATGTPTLVSGFLADSTGAIVYTKRINYCQSTSLPFSMTYDPSTEQYYVAGRMEVNVPMDTNINVPPFANQNTLMKLDNQFQILGKMPLTVMNGNGGSAGLLMQPKNGDLMVGGKIVSSALAHTHIGPHFYLNYDLNNLWMAKIDQNLQFKWIRAFDCTSFSTRFSDMWLHGNYIGMGGHADLIPGIPPPYNCFNGADMFVGIIEDVDSTDIEFMGSVFYDINVNGIRDTLEPGLPSMQCTNTDTSAISFSGIQGSYALTGQVGMNLIRSLTIPIYWYYTTLDTLQSNITVLDTIVTDVNFGAAPIPNIVDLEVIGNDYHPAYLGHGYPIKLDFHQLGTDTTNATLQFILDPVLNYTGSSVTPNSISGDTLLWNLDSLHYFNAGSIIVYSTVPNNVIYQGDSVINYASITSMFSDTAQYNNFDTVINVILQPIDPNDKLSEPGTCIYEPFLQNDQSIEYKVRFQNTGTSPAINVYIVDTISPLLEPSTISIISSSHSCYPEFENGVLKFYFDNINLPDSGANFDASCGFVKFSIQPVNGLPHGAVITNSAEIYFDFNAPVYTGSTNLHYYDQPVSIITEDPSCPLSSDGSIQVINWCSASPALYISINGTSFDTIGNYYSLMEGTYPVYIITEGDTLLFSTVNLVDPPTSTIDSVIGTTTTCGTNNGMIEIYASSAFSGLTYSINGTSFLPTSTFNNLVGGEYPILIQDSLGCEYQWNDSIDLYSINDLIIDSVQVTPSTCNNDTSGWIEVFVHGELGTVLYSTDGVNFNSNPLISGLYGNYQVIVIDSMCSDTLGVFINSLSDLDATVTYTNMNAIPANGTITVTPFGGFYPYTYSINGSSFGPDSTFTNLTAGTYTIEVKDSLGCVQTYTVDLFSTLSTLEFSEFNYSIYPNPANDELFVLGWNAENLNYSILNLFGQFITGGSLDTKGKIYLNNLPAGTYFLKIKSRYWKFIKMD